EQNRLPTLTQHLDCKHYATLPCHDRATPCGGTKRGSAKKGAGSSTDRPSARQPPSLIRAPTAAAEPCMPDRLGWTGAAGDAGTTGSTQRTPGSWHASCPMLAVYASTYVAWFAAACSASMALSFFSTPRR